jgi:hypothetical protein
MPKDFANQQAGSETPISGAIKDPIPEFTPMRQEVLTHGPT